MTTTKADITALTTEEAEATKQRLLEILKDVTDRVSAGHVHGLCLLLFSPTGSAMDVHDIPHVTNAHFSGCLLNMAIREALPKLRPAPRPSTVTHIKTDTEKKA